ncbi:pilus assembly protein TadG-related protein [Umezawaea sp. NPDC059074]|uniref:pilus assembly protein TadG-related protein n=1 Tax=Umezawaea sp. NPDC059074 TaxID=3346716 RepID=UPI0036A3D31E
MNIHPTSLRRRLPTGEGGRVTAFVVILVTACLLFAALVIDGGLALAAKTSAFGEAQEAARTGAQEIDLAAYRAGGAVQLVPTRADSAARAYLAAAGHGGTVSVADDAVQVTVTVTYDTKLLGLVGIGSITVTGTGQAEAQRGISGPRP